MSPLHWFAIFASVTFNLLQCKTHVEAREENQFRTKRGLRDGIAHPGVTDKLSHEWIAELLHSSAGFLAGENTPVWIAHRMNARSRVQYKRLENGIVKKAVDYWKSTEFSGLTNREARSINEHSKLGKKLWYSVVESLSVQTKNISENEENHRTKRRATQAEVLYPSILVMMDYAAPWPQKKQDQQKLIYERILYALAFWNGVDLQLRHIHHPKVRLRIAGIIVAQNKEATPYLYQGEGSSGLNMKKAYGPMLDYWHELSTLKENFPMDAYHIVATMTDTEPGDWFGSEAYAVASPGPPCTFYGEDIGGLMFPDNLAFSGIQVAVHETAHVLGAIRHDGDLEGCPMEKGTVLAPGRSIVGRKWSECSLRHISNALIDRGWCMEKPREFYPPGKPIEPILPGKLMPASKQCQGRGWEDGNVCWEKVTCDYLYCSNDGWISPCRNSGAPADGTTCGPAQICLDGQCISNTTIFWATRQASEAAVATRDENIQLKYIDEDELLLTVLHEKERIDFSSRNIF